MSGRQSRWLATHTWHIASSTFLQFRAHLGHNIRDRGHVFFGNAPQILQILGIDDRCFAIGTHPVRDIRCAFWELQDSVIESKIVSDYLCTVRAATADAVRQKLLF